MTQLGDMPLALTVEQAAAVLGIGRSAGYAGVKSGDIPSIRIGRCIRVPRHRLEQMLGAPTNDVEPAGNGLDAETHAGAGGGRAPA